MISYVIIDDETASHDIIADYASDLPYLLLKHNCYNAIEANEYLLQHEVDLIFLDINMPRLSGFDLLKSLSNPPKIIVTTAHKEFALEGYDLNVTDYLLKPFSFQRFLSAVNKVADSLNVKPKAKMLAVEEAVVSIFLKDSKKYYQVNLADILFAEAYGNYVKVHIEDKVILTHQTFTSFKESLPANKFIQTHKSFLVAIKKIQLVEGNRIFIGEHEIPVGKIYREGVNGLLKSE